MEDDTIQKVCLSNILSDTLKIENLTTKSDNNWINWATERKWKLKSLKNM